MSSSRAQRATLVAPLNVRIAPSPHLAYRLPTELPRRTKLSQDVVSAGHVVTPLADQRARAHFAGTAAEHMGENRPIGSRARPLAVRSAMREP
jgi:hypothetical protein